MLIAKDHNLAPFFYRDGQPQFENPDSDVQLCLPWTVAAEASLSFIRKAGLLPEGPQPHDALKKLIYDMPFAELLSQVDALPPQRREAITREIEADLRERTGRDIRLRADALPFVWRSSSVFLVQYDADKGEDRIWFNVRSHRTDLTIAKNIPSGSGYTAVEDRANIETAEGTAARKLLEESGIVLRDIVPLGYVMRKIPMKLTAMETPDGDTVLGLMTEFTYVGYCRVPPELPLREAMYLDSDSFGSISYSYADLRALSESRAIAAEMYVSQAPFAEAFVGEVRQSIQAEDTALTLPMLTAHALETGRLSPAMSGQHGALNPDPVVVKIYPADLILGEWDSIAVAMQVLQHAGQIASKPDLEYVARHGCIDGLADSFPRPDPIRNPKMLNNSN